MRQQAGVGGEQQEGSGFGCIAAPRAARRLTALQLLLCLMASRTPD